MQLCLSKNVILGPFLFIELNPSFQLYLTDINEISQLFINLYNKDILVRTGNKYSYLCLLPPIIPHNAISHGFVCPLLYNLNAR